MAKLKEALRKAKKPQKKSSEPLWKGPEVDGITFSMLSRWLICRERARLHFIEGLQPVDGFNHRLFYGNMWHVCEESLAGHDGGPWRWDDDLKRYCKELAKQYPTQNQQIEHWFQVCKTQFPLYIDYWAKHPDVTARKPVMQEKVFCVPYKLPSGRAVKLRGKWDSVDYIDGKKDGGGLYIQENKSKGDIKADQMRRQLIFDFQTMIYMVALTEYDWPDDESGNMGCLPIKGVRYNVIRRPLSGGKGSIVQRKGSKNIPPETSLEFYTRLGSIILTDCNEATREKRDSNFFMRWKVDISAKDIENFKQTCLNPILDQLCDWYEYVTGGDLWGENSLNRVHYRMPYGIYSPLLDGGATEVDNYLDTGSTLGLYRVEQLFGELQ